MTGRSITDSTRLKEEIEQVRKNSWARDDGEYSPGAGCVASPVCDHEGQVIAAITVTGPSERIEDGIEDIINMVKSSAVEISKGMGYRRSSESA
jgi:DNA-binding IclR family transcriptional regulator